MRKTVAAAAMAASLTLGGAAGAALFTPTLSGAQTEDTTEATETERGERFAEVLAPLVEDGTITEAQADAVAARLAEARPGRGGHHGARLDLVEAATEALGLEPAELRERLANGSSLADVAEAEGVEVQTLIDALLSAHQERLDEAVADGDLTQEQADERAAAFAARVEDLVERTFDGPMGHGRGMRHDMRGGFAPGDTGGSTDSSEPTDS